MQLARLTSLPTYGFKLALSNAATLHIRFELNQANCELLKWLQFSPVIVFAWEK